MPFCPCVFLPVMTPASGGGPLVDLPLCVAAASLGVARDADGDEQSDAVEHRFDPERAAELLDARDADSEDGDADHRAPHIDSARLDGRRTKKGADQSGKEILEADARPADPEPRGEEHAGNRG